MKITNPIQHLVCRIRYGLLLLPLFILNACSGGSGALPQSSIPAPSLRIEGAVSSPSSSSGSLSAGVQSLRSSSLTDVAATNVGGVVYTLEGEALGSFTTDSSGEFALDVTVSTLKGTDDADTTSWSEGVILECENGIQLYKEIEVTEGETSEADVGTANTDSTLGVQAIATRITGWNGWGTNYKEETAGVNLSCVFETQKAVWESSSSEGGGLFDDQAVIKQVVAGFMAAGGQLSDLGYTSWGNLLQAILDGTAADDDTWSTLVTTAAGVDDTIDEDSYIDNYATAADAFSSVGGVLYEQFSTEGFGIDLTVEGAGSLCDSIKSGDLDARAVVKPMLASDDVDTFTATYGDSSGIAIHFGILKECQETSTCSSVAEQPYAFFGFMQGYTGEFGTFYDSSSGFNAGNIEGFIKTAKQCTSSTAATQKDCGLNMSGMIRTSGGFDDFKSGGTFDPNLIDLFAKYWEAQKGYGFANPQSQVEAYFEQVRIYLKTTLTGTTADSLLSCLNGNPPTTCYTSLKRYNDDSFTEYSDGSTCGGLFQNSCTSDRTNTTPDVSFFGGPFLIVQNHTFKSECGSITHPAVTTPQTAYMRLDTSNVFVSNDQPNDFLKVRVLDNTRCEAYQGDIAVERKCTSCTITQNPESLTVEATSCPVLPSFSSTETCSYIFSRANP